MNCIKIVPFTLAKTHKFTWHTCVNYNSCTLPHKLPHNRLIIVRLKPNTAQKSNTAKFYLRNKSIPIALSRQKVADYTHLVELKLWNKEQNSLVLL